MNSVVR